MCVPSEGENEVQNKLLDWYKTGVRLEEQVHTVMTHLVNQKSIFFIGSELPNRLLAIFPVINFLRVPRSNEFLKELVPLLLCMFPIKSVVSCRIDTKPEISVWAQGVNICAERMLGLLSGLNPGSDKTGGAKAVAQTA